MAESLLEDKEWFSCSVCLELMKDPVTIPCGHSYCMSCIQDYWKKTQLRGTLCPQCRHEYSTRPPLNKNTMLAELLEQLSSSTVQDSSPAPEEVVCDLCAEKKMPAVRSCLHCQVSYCETHLQPHYNVPALKNHKLVVAKHLPTCPRHMKLLEAFCRTDNVCICMSCVMDDHRGHDTVSSAEEREEKQVTLQVNKLKYVEKREEKENELDELMKVSETHANATQQSVDVTQQAFNSLIGSLEKSCSEMIEKIQAQEKLRRNEAADLQEKLEFEIATLMEQEDAMDKLLKTEDDVHFLQNFASMPSPSPAEPSLSHTSEPLESFSDVSEMISEFKVKLEDFCKQELDKIFTQRTPRIRIGDRVRVKSTVKSPTFNWGAVTPESVGVVVSVSGETLIIDFPKNKNWKGLLSEMERVTDKSALSEKNPGSAHLRCADGPRLFRMA